MTYVYAHFFSNGDKYVGISNNPKQRWKEGFDSNNSKQYNHKVLIANEKYDKLSLIISEKLPMKIAEKMESILINRNDVFNLNIKKEDEPYLYGNDVICINTENYSHVYPKIDGEILFHSPEIEENNNCQLSLGKELTKKEIKEIKKDRERVLEETKELKKEKEKEKMRRKEEMTIAITIKQIAESYASGGVQKAELIKKILEEKSNLIKIQVERFINRYLTADSGYYMFDDILKQISKFAKIAENDEKELARCEKNLIETENYLHIYPKIDDEILFHSSETGEIKRDFDEEKERKSKYDETLRKLARRKGMTIQQFQRIAEYDNSQANKHSYTDPTHFSKENYSDSNDEDCFDSFEEDYDDSFYPINNKKRFSLSKKSTNQKKVDSAVRRLKNLNIHPNYGVMGMERYNPAKSELDKAKNILLEAFTNCWDVDLTDLAHWIDLIQIACDNENRRLGTPTGIRRGPYYQSIEKRHAFDYGICPVCGADLVKRKGKHGNFLGCSNFPKCEFTTYL